MNQGHPSTAGSLNQSTKSDSKSTRWGSDGASIAPFSETGPLIWHRPCRHCPAWNSFNIENILNSTPDHEVFLLDLLFFSDFLNFKLYTNHCYTVSLPHISRWYNWSCSVECTCNNSLCLSPSTWSATLLNSMNEFYHRHWLRTWCAELPTSKTPTTLKDWSYFH